jgi:hypothetical protein
MEKLLVRKNRGWAGGGGAPIGAAGGRGQGSPCLRVRGKNRRPPPPHFDGGGGGCTTRSCTCIANPIIRGSAWVTPQYERGGLGRAGGVPGEPGRGSAGPPLARRRWKKTNKRIYVRAHRPAAQPRATPPRRVHLNTSQPLVGVREGRTQEAAHTNWAPAFSRPLPKRRATGALSSTHAPFEFPLREEAPRTGRGSWSLSRLLLVWQEKRAGSLRRGRTRVRHELGVLIAQVVAFSTSRLHFFSLLSSPARPHPPRPHPSQAGPCVTAAHYCPPPCTPSSSFGVSRTSNCAAALMPPPSFADGQLSAST